MLLAELVDVSTTVAGNASRLAKIEALATALRHAEPDEAPAVVAFLSGELLQRQIGVGWAALRDLPTPAAQPSLTVHRIAAVFAEIATVAGKGSTARRRELLAGLFGQATGAEQQFLRRLLGGELRQGAQEGLMVEAVARAAEVPAALIRRALMVRGDLRAVATAAVGEGATGLEAFRLAVGRGLRPMLAQSAPDVAAALERIHPAALEWKLDGVRVQVHRDGSDVRVFTRTLDDITARVPDVAAAALELPVTSAVLDGEVIALREDDSPLPFQVTASRVGSRSDPARMAASLPLRMFLFDALHLDGEDLVDRPGAERQAALEVAAPAAVRVPRAVVDDPAAGEEFLAGAVARGHEGVVVKSLTTPYEAGRRGAGWVKVKPRHTLDLVVLAAEWGHGRRQGTLSNLHLGARDPAAGGFVMLGKTFKGLTDALLAWQTERFLELEIARDDWTVYVKPEVVVEIAYDGLQASTRYPGGVALRFARVLRYRPDKAAADADTIDTVRAQHAAAGAPPSSGLAMPPAPPA